MAAGAAAVTEFPVADAHLHVWDPQAHYYPWLCDAQPIAFRYGDYRALRRRYLVADYRKDIGRWPVTRGVYVEAEWDPRDPIGEMDFVGKLIAKGFPTVAVAQAWLDREDCARVLRSHARRGFVRGVRHKPKPGLMHDEQWRAGYALLGRHELHFELQAPWPMLAEAARLARDFPRTTIVLNHAGLPADDQLVGWRHAMAGMAACPNVVVKISGLGRVTRKREAVLTTIELFGAGRCMFGSNYPVDSLCDKFDDIYSDFDEFTAALKPAERRALFYDNAIRIYRMERL
jgi:predicted TIM-barrel fold metal-dependent hydrolase